MGKWQEHIHKYMRVKLGNSVVYRCMLAGCPHYVRKELALKRKSVCWRCGRVFVLGEKALLLKKPHCADCLSPAESEKRDKNLQARLAKTGLTLSLDEIRSLRGDYDAAGAPSGGGWGMSGDTPTNLDHKVAANAALVVKVLEKRPNCELSRQRLLSKLWGDMDAIDLDKAVPYLLTSGFLKVYKVGNQIMYKLTPAATAMGQD